MAKVSRLPPLLCLVASVSQHKAQETHPSSDLLQPSFPFLHVDQHCIYHKDKRMIENISSTNSGEANFHLLLVVVKLFVPLVLDLRIASFHISPSKLI